MNFNADEIFEMALEIERNGEKFYRKAAKSVSDEDARQTFLELADMEGDHIKTFSEMREELSNKELEPTIFDPDNQAAMYLQAMADGHVFDLKMDPSQQLRDVETVENIVKLAIEAEKNSIIFYLGMKELVPARLGKDKVEAIIKEEMGHIAVLNQKFQS